MADNSAAEPSPKRRRTSRAGQAKRFECLYPGCGKHYSRAEHLHRHELNHQPREIYRCDIPCCGHTFVRADLYARHRARHNPLPGTPSITDGTNPPDPTPPISGNGTYTTERRSVYTTTHPHQDTGAVPTQWTPTNQQSLLTPVSSVIHVASPPSHSLSVLDQQTATSADLPFNADKQWAPDEGSTEASINFAAWLFESPGSQSNELDTTELPFLDFGFQNPPNDIGDASSNHRESALNRYSQPAAISAQDTSATFSPSKLISDHRRTEIVLLLANFNRRQSIDIYAVEEDPTKMMYSPDGLQFPNLTVNVLDNLVANYWLSANQMPIVHEATFAGNGCHVLLLLAMIALGATDLVRTKPRGEMAEYKDLAQLIMTQLRWEIFTDSDAQPPIQLWVAQTLLLLEYYEKQCSTRKLHERAHIHHGTTLTLLRRGNPLVGRSESESPSSGLHSRPATPSRDADIENGPGSGLNSWWLQWVRNESFNRVVFTAFQMDTLHAVMYGHAADMTPYEIRLPLPCDDALWNATDAVEVQRLDANLKMYGIKPVNFLDGLKRCLHAHDVQTHAPARMLLMAGLLNVGWQISRREKHLQFLETIPSVREQGRWRVLLLRAFSHWRDSFDKAVGSRSGNPASKIPNFNSARAAVLFHLAHMTLHVDIIDCQIFAGTKEILGRTVSKKDFLRVVQRMTTWACTPVARHATLHAYKLLHCTLIKPTSPRKRQESDDPTTNITYNCRTDPVNFRPRAIFIAGLIIWSYQYASSLYLATSPSQGTHYASQDEQSACCQYLQACAAIDDPALLAPVLSTQGCAAVLSALSRNFSNADPELLHEASKRLQECRDALGMSLMNRP